VHPFCWLCRLLVMLHHCLYPPFFFAVAVAFVDFWEVDLTLVGVAFLLLFGGDVMDLVAGEFDFCLFVAVGVVLPLETLLFFDDSCCYRKK
jgi:hypothetical protein